MYDFEVLLTSNFGGKKFLEVYKGSFTLATFVGDNTSNNNSIRDT